MKDKTSHRLQSENIADSLQSQTFDRRERKMSNLHGCPSGNLQCIASPMPLQDLLRIYHIRKIPNIATLAFDLNITYRAILNIELYKWQLQKGLQKLRYCITVYLYKAIHCKAVAPDVKLYAYTLYILIHTITLYGEYDYTRYMLIQDIPLYVVDVYMPIGLYSFIVYRYAIVIWLYIKSRHGTNIQFGVCTKGGNV